MCTFFIVLTFDDVSAITKPKIVTFMKPNFKKCFAYFVVSTISNNIQYTGILLTTPDVQYSVQVKQIVECSILNMIFTILFQMTKEYQLRLLSTKNTKIC